MHITDYKANEVQCWCTDAAIYRLCISTYIGVLSLGLLTNNFLKKRKKKDIVQNIFLFCNTISIYLKKKTKKQAINTTTCIYSCIQHVDPL